jgi:hypothetical protein
MANQDEELKGSRFRRFMRQVGERIGQVFANPMISVWDSARRDERRRKRRD